METLREIVTPVGKAGLRVWEEHLFERFNRLALARAAASEQFQARMRVDGDVAVRTCVLAGTSHAVRRSELACGPEIGLLKIVAGRTRIKQGGLDCTLAPSDVALFDNSRPYALDMQSGFEHTVILLDRATWAPEVAEFDRHGGGKLPPTAATKILATMLESSVRLAATMDAAELQDVVQPLVQLATIAVRPPSRSVSRDRISLSLLTRVCADIRNRLPDPDLSPPQLAQRHGISLRYLHKLFATHGMTVMQFVRNERLARCAHELRARGRRAQIAAIAARWGFYDDATFRRAFRVRYGVSPSAFTLS